MSDSLKSSLFTSIRSAKKGFIKNFWLWLLSKKDIHILSLCTIEFSFNELFYFANLNIILFIFNPSKKAIKYK